MMVVPLTVCANPAICISNPVYLLPGVWEIICDNDKVPFELILTDIPTSTEDKRVKFVNGVKVEGHKVVRIDFSGDRPNIATSISAKKCQ